MVTDTVVHSNLAIPPGEYLEEVLEELGMTKDELARRMGRPASKLTAIFKGEKSITPETSLQLETVTGVPAHIWSGLESEYQLTQAKNEQAKQLKAETHLVTRFCYRFLVNAGEIESLTKPEKKVRELQEFFGVTSLHRVFELNRYQAVFRCGKAGEQSPEAVAAWLRLGERRAHRTECRPHNEKRLRGLLENLRSLTLKQPGEFRPRLREMMAECGVALVICPHFPKTKAQGATFWLGRDKAVLMITNRGKWADIFWFSLFHEIGHILLHGKKATILELDGDSQREEEANRFAADVLIPPRMWKEFLIQGNFYKDSVKRFAEKAGIHPGIVVGRLQKEKVIKPQWLNDLRERVDWQEQI